MAGILKVKVLLANTGEELDALAKFLNSVEIIYMIQIAEHKVLVVYEEDLD